MFATASAVANSPQKMQVIIRRSNGRAGKRVTAATAAKAKTTGAHRPRAIVLIKIRSGGVAPAQQFVPVPMLGKVGWRAACVVFH